MFFLQVDFRLNFIYLMCFCNYLMFFGGNFIQVLNFIDFDKVVIEIIWIDEFGNILVLVIVVIFFFLYIVVLFFVRRVDKRDVIKVIIVERVMMFFVVWCLQDR